MPPHQLTASINQDARPAFTAAAKKLQSLGKELIAGSDFGSRVLRSISFDLWAEREPNLLRQLLCRPYPGDDGTLFLAAHLPLPELERASAGERVALAMSALAASVRTWPSRHPVPPGFDQAGLAQKADQFIEERGLARDIAPLFLPRFTSLSITHQGSRVFSRFPTDRFVDAFNRQACEHLRTLGGELRNVRLYLEYLEDDSRPEDAIFRLDPFYRWAAKPGVEALVWLRLPAKDYGALGAQKQLLTLRAETSSRLRNGLRGIDGLATDEFCQAFDDVWTRSMPGDRMLPIGQHADTVVSWQSGPKTRPKTPRRR